jgi:hypothetical protein
MIRTVELESRQVFFLYFNGTQSLEMHKTGFGASTTIEVNLL